jgi:hypothetical protein
MSSLPARLWLSALALLLAAGCSPPDPDAAAIPRHALPDSLVGSMHYDPVDVPLAWTRRGELVVGHQEVYNNGDVYSPSCPGTGFYAVATDGGKVRPLAVGGAACLGFDEQPAAVSAAGDWAVFSRWAPPSNMRLVRLTFATGRIDTLPATCAGDPGNLSLSPDGRRIAASGQCRDRQQDPSGLYTLDIGSSGLRQIADSSGAAASWSPDGQRLAATLDGKIVVMAADGTGRRAITTGGDASWSPDGEWIAFRDSVPGVTEALGVFAVRPDGSGRREVFRNRVRSTYERGWGPIREGEPAQGLVWSPDSRWIAFPRRFDRGTSVWRVEVESGRVEQVTRAGR